MAKESQKTRTTSYAVIAIVAALALLGVVVLTVAIDVPLQQQQAFAAKECTFEPGTSCYCYSLQPGGIMCFGNKGDCNKSQRANVIAASGCFKYGAF